ncbi:5'-3' exonuclease [Paraoerskovia sediminicola]|uniref:5'-3' exonuclease n=1 Tax=Paraoerskovia sediminicola TaxID=1138587 RepID=A0ABN6XA58_9CELL|nr:5'-3' exonuclease [Paraoerskovia sediminicola]BDZ41729.1 5'-3' exonuclease [Paraoerskovia sediminicola]
MAETREKLLLLDTASLYFRAFYGVPDKITAPDGTPVNAVRGLLDMIATLVTDHRPTRLVACWDDDWRPQFRVDAIPSYKAHRMAGASTGTGTGTSTSTGTVGPAPAPTHGAGSAYAEEVPDLLTPQVPVIVDALAALGIARVGCPGFEADDVIGTLVAREITAGSGTPVDVVTGDRDLFQLVDDTAHVRVLYTSRGIKNLDAIDEARLAEKYGVPTGRAYLDMSMMRGDPSDGLPGVQGIGEKTAATLLARYGDLAGVLAARDDPDDRGLTATQRTRLLAASDYLDAAPVVVTVAPDAPLGDVDDTLPGEAADPDALDALAERWGLGSSVQRVLDAMALGD